MFGLGTSNSDGTTTGVSNSTIYVILGIVILLLLGGVGFLGYKVSGYNNTLSNYEKTLKESNDKIAKLVDENGKLVVDLAKAKKDYAEMDTKTQSTTQVVYVPKTSPTDADVEINKAAPKVKVTAGDGTAYEYKPDTKSTQNIKDGKLVVSEDSTLHLDVEKIVDARFKDKIEALQAKHDQEIKAKDAELDKTKRKLNITIKQRDFYGGVAAAETTAGLGVMIVHHFK